MNGRAGYPSIMMNTASDMRWLAAASFEFSGSLQTWGPRKRRSMQRHTIAARRSQRR